MQHNLISLFPANTVYLEKSAWLLITMNIVYMWTFAPVIL